MAEDFEIVVLLSGRGSNFLNLCEKLRSAKIAALLTNVPEAPGLQHAAPFGIPTITLDRKDSPSLKAFKGAILERLQSLTPDLVVLAGFMQILEPEFINAFPGRIINIHPSLLPKFPGLHTHERAIEAGEALHGCTVHFVDAGVDTGPIVAQAKCPVNPGDTAEVLAARVLEQEHRLYPWVIDGIARGEISLEGSRVQLSRAMVEEAAQLGFIIPSPGPRPLS